MFKHRKEKQDTHVVVMGAGEEISYFIETLRNDIKIIGFGYSLKYAQSITDIIALCTKHSIHVFTNINELDYLNPDVIFLASYPDLIPQSLISKFLFINMHGALLPAYQGMHGGTWAIINGENKHGFTLHKVDEGIDSGPIYFQIETTLELNDTVISLRKKIFHLYKANIKNVFLDILEGKIIPYEQDLSQMKVVCKRKPYDGLIDWTASSWEVYNFIRALIPPYTEGAFTFYKNVKCYIIEAELFKTPNYKSICGQVVKKIQNKGVLVKCGDGVILIKKIAYQKITIYADQFFNTVGARFSNE